MRSLLSCIALGVSLFTTALALEVGIVTAPEMTTARGYAS